MLDRVRIVLCETTHPGNIGAAARAMLTMGLTRLTLVAPRHFPDPEATARASGADRILEDAQVVPTLRDALDGAHYAVGTAARTRSIPMPQFTPRDGIERVAAEAGRGDVAIVFGTERSGLSNDEADACQALITIPTDPDFSSLNLGSAVQLICYELRMALADTALEPAAPVPLPDLRALESFFDHLEEALFDIRFLVPGQSSTMMTRLRRLVHRATPTLTELDILRGILSRAQLSARGRPD
ncbi:MAG: RNA methyltransferase [Pseudomonadota bacterium]